MDKVLKSNRGLVLLLLCCLIFSFSTMAEMEAGFSVPPEELAPLLQPVVDTIRPLFIQLSVLVGGIFGLYFLLILFRIYYERKKVRLLQHIRFDLDQLNMHYKIPTSKDQKNGIKRLIWKLRGCSKKEKK